MDFSGKKRHLFFFKKCVEALIFRRMGLTCSARCFAASCSSCRSDCSLSLLSRALSISVWSSESGDSELQTGSRARASRSRSSYSSATERRAEDSSALQNSFATGLLSKWTIRAICFISCGGGRGERSDCKHSNQSCIKSSYPILSCL